MLTIFWDAKGMLYTEFLIKELMVNSDRYCATLWSLKQRIRRIRLERNTFLLQHDNARPHCSAQTQDAMISLKFTVVPHPPYRPDLAPSHFWFFPKLKMLKSKHFLSDAEFEAAVRKWISSQPETFFMDRINKWIEWLKKMCSRKGWLCWEISVQCVREINFFHSDITVIILHCHKLILYNWRPYLSITRHISVHSLLTFPFSQSVHSSMNNSKWNVVKLCMLWHNQWIPHTSINYERKKWKIKMFIMQPTVIYWSNATAGLDALLNVHYHKAYVIGCLANCNVGWENEKTCMLW